MKTLKVIVCKAGKGVSAHLPEVDGYVIARETVEKLKRDLPDGLAFHIEGLHEEERKPWMNEPLPIQGSKDSQVVFGFSFVRSK